MKVCLVEERFLNPRTTGPAKHANDLANALSGIGHDVLVVCDASSDVGGSHTVHDEGRNRIRVVRLKSIGMGHQRLLRGLIALIRDEKPDVVHSQGYRNLSTDATAISSKLNKIPFVLSPRGSLYGYSHRAVDSLVPIAARIYDLATLKQTLRLANAVVVTSLAEKGEALRIGIPPERIELIPHGMAFPQLPRAKLELEGYPCLLTVGRITPRRNIAAIIQSIRLVAREYPKVMLYVAGDPIRDSYDRADLEYPRLVSELANNPTLKNHVRLLGGVYGENLWSLYSSCDAFIYASSYDNFGFGLLEAAYFGLPIVSTNVGVAPDLIQVRKGGMLLDNHEPGTIGRATLELLRDWNRRAEIGGHLRSLAREYSIERNCKAYAKLYHDLANERNGEGNHG